MSDEKQRMPEHGEITWTEIATTNLEQVDAFYSKVFGWKIKKQEGQDFEYRHFEDGRGYDVGGIYEMNDEMFGGQTPPPHFISYVAVDDVDETVAEVTSLGGSILKEPTDIPGTGRMAVLTDPTGAAFAVIHLNGGESRNAE